MQDRAYVCVLSYPTDMSERERALALSESLGVDEYTAGIVSKWPTPSIVKLCPLDEARQAGTTLEDLGISCHVTRHDHIERLSNRIVAKRLRAALDAPQPMYAYEPLRPRLHEPGGFAMSSVFVMIAGRVCERRTHTSAHIPTEDRMPGPYSGADSAFAHAGGSGNVLSSRAAERQILDLYLKDARCIRIDTGQFSFDVLEGKLGLTDRENFARFCERLRAEAPHAVFDEDFETFRPPGNRSIHQSRSFADGTVNIVNNGPAFDFYSAWKCLLLVSQRRKSR